MKNIPKYKTELINALKKVSNDKEFILSVGSAAGQSEEDSKKLIGYIENENPTESEVMIFALEIYYSGKQ